jgi:hypothetical protein
MSTYKLRCSNTWTSSHFITPAELVQFFASLHTKRCLTGVGRNTTWALKHFLNLSKTKSQYSGVKLLQLGRSIIMPSNTLNGIHRSFAKLAKQN